MKVKFFRVLETPLKVLEMLKESFWGKSLDFSRKYQ